MIGFNLIKANDSQLSEEYMVDIHECVDYDSTYNSS